MSQLVQSSAIVNIASLADAAPLYHNDLRASNNRLPYKCIKSIIKESGASSLRYLYMTHEILNFLYTYLLHIKRNKFIKATTQN